ncbi:MAG: hypothetical protein H6868_08310 [Rhodospirillales bacterium]|nr:hypothetical protein [Rhodospirillales bacterium]
MDTTDQNPTDIRDLVDRALSDAEGEINVDETIAMFDRQMEELEELEARICKSIVVIDDLRALFAARRKPASQQ